MGKGAPSSSSTCAAVVGSENAPATNASHTISDSSAVGDCRRFPRRYRLPALLAAATAMSLLLLLLLRDSTPSGADAMSVDRTQPGRLCDNGDCMVLWRWSATCGRRGRLLTSPHASDRTKGMHRNQCERSGARLNKRSPARHHHDMYHIHCVHSLELRPERADIAGLVAGLAAAATSQPVQESIFRHRADRNRIHSGVKPARGRLGCSLLVN